MTERMKKSQTNKKAQKFLTMYVMLIVIFLTMIMGVEASNTYLSSFSMALDKLFTYLVSKVMKFYHV